jgi:integrase
MALKKRADGRYVRTIKDERTGKRIYFYGTSEREINKKIFEYQTKCEKGRLFSEVADEWWDEAYERISPNSVKGYKVAYRRALEYFGDIPICNITPKDIGLWMRKLAKLKFSYKTVKNHKIVVSRILQTAVMDGDIDYNPANQAEVPRGMPQKIRTPACENDEIIINKTADMWLLPYTALMSGLRKGELLALQWKDIDFENNLIHVSKSVYYDGNIPKIKAPKTVAGIRPVILLSGLREELEKRKGAPDEFIFSLDGGKTPYTESRYDKLMKDYKKATGITATAQQLRKSFATKAAASNVDTKVLQRVMGHTDIRTTLGIYASVDNAAWLNARELLENKMHKK